MHLRFSLRQIEYFVAVGEAGSIALASERIHISSPSISAAISQLEQQFGIQLFVRQHAQGLTLTPGGRRFLQEAKILLEKAEHLHDVASDITESVKGPLSIGCLVTMAPYVMGRLRKSFEGDYPEVWVTQHIDNQANLLSKISRAEVDAALTYDLDIPQDIRFDPLAKLPPYVMLSHDHPLADRKTINIEELVDHPMVMLDLPLSRDYFLSLFHQTGLRPLIGETATDMGVMRSMVANGFGYGLANLRPQNEMSPEGLALKHVPLEGDYRPVVIGIATMRTDYTSAVMNAFMEHCHTSFRNNNFFGAQIATD
ncbi:LysR substrate-binding domain-containing protein [Curvivirga sp.]|uniref:LysR substrate-binding domain-containing protein n=1 Tax=Curvivirga sp. TaxID=2856848 RepID=UPI003B5A13B2